MSNAPTVLLGLVPLIRAVVRSETTDEDTTVTADDSGTLFVNLSDQTDHEYELPTVALGKGKVWAFFNGQTDSTLTITGGTTDKMMVNDQADADGNKASADAGAWAIVVCDGTYYYCLEGSGSWATQT